MHRGRTIRTPAGTATRPTADRVREALFSRLDAVVGGCDGAVVLDAFAGSGALGIEALSRAARSAVFVERSRSATNVIRDNLDSLGLTEASTVLGGDVLSLARANRLGSVPFSLLFLDPPYRINKSEVRTLIEVLRQHGRVAPDAVVVWEHSTGDSAEWPSGFRSIGTKRYGSTEVDMAVVDTHEEDA